MRQWLQNDSKTVVLLSKAELELDKIMYIRLCGGEIRKTCFEQYPGCLVTYFRAMDKHLALWWNHTATASLRTLSMNGISLIVNRSSEIKWQMMTTSYSRQSEATNSMERLSTSLWLSSPFITTITSMSESGSFPSPAQTSQRDRQHSAGCEYRDQSLF